MNKSGKSTFWLKVIAVVMVLAAITAFGKISGLFQGNLSNLQVVKQIPKAVESNKKTKNVVVDENGKVQNGSGGNLGQYADNSTPNDHSCEKGFMENGQKIWSYCEGVDFKKTITYVNGTKGVNSLKTLGVASSDSFIKKIQDIGVDYVDPSRPENHTFQGKYTTVSEVVGYIGLSLSNDANPGLLFALDPYTPGASCGGDASSETNTDGNSAPCFLGTGVFTTPVSQLNNMEKLNIVLKNNEVVRLEDFVHNFKEVESSPSPTNIRPGTSNTQEDIGHN